MHTDNTMTADQLSDSELVARYITFLDQMSELQRQYCDLVHQATKASWPKGEALILVAAKIQEVAHQLADDIQTLGVEMARRNG